MLFSSMEFIFVFLPAVMGVNLLLRGRARNYWLLLSSLLFYAWGEPSFVFVMIGSIILNYVTALLIDHFRDRSGWKKALLAANIVCNLSVLFVFKYLNFVTRTIRAWFPGMIPLIPETSVILPIGISFFTFQALSYVIDVYRGTSAQKNPAYLGLYISLFPQLIAGPIVRYGTIAEQIESRKITLADFSEGILTFLRGFNKKILLANVLAEVADKAFGSSGNSIGMAWLGALCYTLQIYFDFGGYSDMAIGLGRMLGFRFEKNFDYPYISRTITEFWRRWHISLGSFFRDYLYIPMGGNRRHQFFNILVVWFLTGMWHGASWNFILWGLYFGLIVALEKYTILRWKVPGWLLHLYSLVLVVLGWGIFYFVDFSQMTAFFPILFGKAEALSDFTVRSALTSRFWLWIAALVCCLPLGRWIRDLVGEKRAFGRSVLSILKLVFSVALLTVSVALLVGATNNPFIYTRF